MTDVGDVAKNRALRAVRDVVNAWEYVGECQRRVSDLMPILGGYIEGPHEREKLEHEKRRLATAKEQYLVKRLAEMDALVALREAWGG